VSLIRLPPPPPIIFNEIKVLKKQDGNCAYFLPFLSIFFDF